MAPIIGIDLGTTNSCSAYCDEAGEVHLIRYRGGEFTIPSMYAINNKGEELVGHDARRQWQLNPNNTIYGSKRLVGTAIDSELVAEMRDHVAYEMSAGREGDVVLKVAGRNLPLQEIAGKILSRIRDVASDTLGVPVERAVVTVPAYYNDRQRQAVRSAGAQIGLKILRILNEPTAAALAYGAKGYEKRTVAIYDLGGGTFDISVIEIRNRVLEVKSTGGDIFLGGIDFDNALVEYVLSDFKAKHDVDLSKDAVAMQRVRDAAERIKVDLSAGTEAPLHIPFAATKPDGSPVDVEITITREEMEMLTEHLVEKTFVTVAKAIDDAGLQPDDIEEVLLVGGQTRMPLIQQRVLDFFGKPPSKKVHPDEAVAIGAALYAWSLDEKSDLKYQLLDVVPMAVSIVGATGDLHQIFQRNSSVPNRTQLTFTTHRDNQPDLVMRIVQGDQPTANDNELLGEFTFSGLHAGPAGSVRCEVVFDLNDEGILALDAKDLKTGATMQQTVRFGSSHL